jgi:hypothetical protein
MNKYLQVALYAFAMLLLVLGGIKLGIVGLTSTLSIQGYKVPTVFLLLVGFAALSVGMVRDFYLPFLGETLVPCAILEVKAPDNADTSVTVLIPPNRKVLYWAAEPETDSLHELLTWRSAYLEYKNAGVALSDSDGRAILKVRKPQGYRVPTRVLPPHVHYRVCGDEGFLGPVRTVKMDGKELFEDYAPADKDLPLTDNDNNRYGMPPVPCQMEPPKQRLYTPPPILELFINPETQETVPGAPWLYTNADNVASTISSYAANTAERAATLMPQSGALVADVKENEAPFTAGLPAPNAGYVEG